MSIINSLLDKIREYPGMYLGTPSLNNLWMYLHGYSYAMNELQVESNDDIDLQIYPWLENKWSLKLNTNWYKLIMLYSSNEEYAFNLFYQLLDEFRSMNKDKYKVTVTKTTTKTYTFEVEATNRDEAELLVLDDLVDKFDWSSYDDYEYEVQSVSKVSNE